MKKTIKDLVGDIITHTKYGACKVVEVTNLEECKFKGMIMETGELKQFVFSTKFFKVKGEFEFSKIELAKKVVHHRPHKPIDYNKHRNHPLVKEIDRREAGIRVRVIPEPEEEHEEQA